jgi:hypothetical protein
LADRIELDGERRWRLFLWLCAALRGDRPDWPSDPADTQPLIALAGDHFITPTLAVAMKDAAGLPSQVREYLGAVALLNRERNEHILAAVDSAAVCLAEAGITAVFLKGAAHLVDGLYPDLACRFLGDVDVLVPRLAAPAAIRALADIGFSDFAPSTRRWIALRRHDSPLQRHVDSGVGIEVHREVLNLAYPGLVSSDVVLQTAVPANLRNGVLVSDTRTRALHAILHDQLGHGWRRRRCGLRTLCDVAQLFAKSDAEQHLADLTRGLPSSVRLMINHVLALAGLVGAPAEPDATDRAVARARLGMERPRHALPDGLVDGFSRLRFQPLAAINLLDPWRWPERLARLRAWVKKFPR